MLAEKIREWSHTATASDVAHLRSDVRLQLLGREGRQPRTFLCLGQPSLGFLIVWVNLENVTIPLLGTAVVP